MSTATLLPATLRPASRELTAPAIASAEWRQAAASAAFGALAGSCVCTLQPNNAAREPLKTRKEAARCSRKNFVAELKAGQSGRACIGSGGQGSIRGADRGPVPTHAIREQQQEDSAVGDTTQL